MTESRRTILVIEDEAAIRESIVDYLEDRDFRVLAVDNGRDGIALFESHHPSVVLTDLRMPEGDGLSVLRHVTAASPEIPAIVISGTGHIADAVAALRLGAWDYLLKPVEEMSVITHAIDRALERARILRTTLAHQSDLEALVRTRTADLRHTNERLRASEARFRELTDMLPEAVFEADTRLNLTYANQRAFELFGASQEDFDRGLNAMDVTVREDQQRALEMVKRRLRGEELGALEYRGRRQDGSEFPFLLHMQPIKEGEKILGFRGVAVDISARRKAEEERARLEKQYQKAQRVESIGRLAGGVAHDLNNLLLPILGYAELLLDDPAECKESLKEILRAGERARDLVRQLLAFCRKQTLEYKALDFNELFSGFEKLLRRTIREDISIEIHRSPHAARVLADVGQIERVLTNLAVNAQDAMPKGGSLTLSITQGEKEVSRYGLESETLGASEAGGSEEYVRLTVTDTGTGMDEDTQEQLFEPFFSTKGESGTGLGLATVYGIIKQHGGDIRFFSEEGEGTTFEIDLPVDKEGREGKERASEARSDRLVSETILLVEDNVQVRRVAHMMLKRRGYRVLVADSGEAAFQILEAQSGTIDLLLTDVVMPEMSGKELFLKASARYPDLKVLYMSGYSDDVIAHRGILDAGVHFIQKPFSVAGLVEKLREVLREGEESRGDVTS